MSEFKRRHFLQLAGSTLASIGLSQTDFLRQSERYASALAQGPGKKLALLVGINRYPAPVRSLNGCVNDVQLQRQLLIHRFGFSPDNIIVLTDDTELKPTRQNILRAFQDHLIAKAGPEDVVVFHYSGHGSRVIDPDPILPGDAYRQNGTLVPMDAVSLADQGDQIVVPDIMGRTLFLLTKSLRTDNVTMILDSCHSGASTRGSSAVRTDSSRLSRSGTALVASEEEFNFQNELLEKLKLSKDDFQAERQRIAKGIALGSTRRDQEALDKAFPGFNAGVFTYLLTRYLWQITGSEPVARTEVNLQRSTRILADQNGFSQIPVFEYANETYKTKPAYLTQPIPAFAEAVITNITGEQIEFWLGGTSEQNLEADETIYTLVLPSGEALMVDGETPVALKKTQRNGLYGYGRLITGNLSDIRPGILLREQVLGLQPNPTLKIQVDTALEDSNEAKSALEALLRSSSGVNRLDVSLLSDVKPTDYIFGQFSIDKQTKLANVDSVPETLPPLGTLGLFTPQEIPLTHTFGYVNESIASAVNRLASKFKLFLANKILRGFTNSNSQLDISGKIFTAERPNVEVPIRASNAQFTQSSPVSLDFPAFKTNESIQIQVDNRDKIRDLYLSCLAIDSSGTLIILYPGDWDVPEEAARIDQGSSLTIPRPEDEMRFQVSGSGFLEILTLVSTQPLRNTLKGLQSIARSRGITRGFLDTRGDEPLALLGDLLGDLDQLSRSGDATVQAVSNQTSFNRSAWDTSVLAAFSTSIEVVE